jgi:hypothetical protein
VALVRNGGELALLLACIDQAYNRKSWHGTNLRGSLRRVTARTAAWRPAPERHNIWELTVHAAYWKYAVWRRLTGEARGSFAIRGSNWFRRPDDDSSDAAWRADVALLDRVHRDLRAAIAALPPRELRRTPAGSKVSTTALISGVAAHDVYHAGQIQLIKRLAEP